MLVVTCFWTGCQADVDLLEKRPPPQEHQACSKEGHDDHVVDVVSAVVRQDDAVPVHIPFVCFVRLLHPVVERVDVEDGNDVEGHEEQEVVTEQEGFVPHGASVVTPPPQPTQKHHPDFSDQHIPDVSEDWVFVQEICVGVVSPVVPDGGFEEFGHFVRVDQTGHGEEQEKVGCYLFGPLPATVSLKIENFSLKIPKKKLAVSVYEF